MEQNDPGREPTDAELLCSHTEAAVRKDTQFCIATIRASDATYAALIDRGREYLSGARPMPETPADNLRAFADDLAAKQVTVDLPFTDQQRWDMLEADKPVPPPAAPVCYAPTRVDGKFRTCELPSGHEGRHESHLGGETVWWENNGPECEHGHLARVCVICELIAAEARIADLEQEYERKLRQVIETWTIRCDAHRGATEAAEARVAELEAELAEVKVCAKMLLDLHFLGGSSGQFNAAIDRLYKCITPAGSDGKEAPYAE